MAPSAGYPFETLTGQACSLAQEASVTIRRLHGPAGESVISLIKEAAQDMHWRAPLSPRRLLASCADMLDMAALYYAHLSLSAGYTSEGEYL